MTEHVVTAHGGVTTYPYIVAADPAQRRGLVRLALHDRGLSGLAALTHGRAYFYVWHRPVIGVDPGEGPREHLRVGFFAKFGAAMFNVDPREPGDHTPTSQDWAWLALRPEPIADPPTVYFEQESQVQFPPRCIMPIDELAELVHEYVETGKRPTSVEWLTVNALYWTLDGAGDIATD